jgi:alkanesulfonate monooxygenase SsuD/methylene tetrahydromethanopterin reductase-like flavin-dependent oxidoreductase (luciferase family)
MALQAEAGGLDSIWIPDHLLFRFPDRPAFGVWECWSILAGLAEATERVELGPLVMCLPFRNPALLAKMAITTDEVSNGRLILGLGAGWHQPEFDAFGVPYAHLVDQFEEGLRIIVPLLREGKVDFHGKYFSAPNCELRPRGPRPGGPPVLIAARGKRMLRLTAQYADQWNWAWSGRPTVFRQKHAELVQACQETGRDPATMALTVGLNIVYPEQLTQAEAEFLPESYSDPDWALRGTTKEIAAGLLAYADLGVDHLICNPTPNTPETHAELTKALQLLRGTDVGHVAT